MKYDNIRKLATGQGDNYATVFLLDYNYFKNCYKMIVIDLSKQQTLNADTKVIQQIILAKIYLKRQQYLPSLKKQKKQS